MVLLVHLLDNFEVIISPLEGYLWRLIEGIPLCLEFIDLLCFTNQMLNHCNFPLDELIMLLLQKVLVFLQLLEEWDEEI